MTEPHHHVFRSLRHAIIASVKIEAILDHIISKNIIKRSEVQIYKSKNGMNRLLSLLRNRDYETFLSFVDCIFLAQKDPLSKVQSVPIVDSIVRVVQDFDQLNKTSYASKVIDIQQTYLKQSQTETVEQPLETLQTVADEAIGLQTSSAVESTTSRGSYWSFVKLIIIK